MALTNCPNCGKEVSTRAAVCPGCGYGFSAAQESEPEQPTIQKCEDCGTEIPEGGDVCPNCGCPVPQVEAEEPKETEKTQKVEVTKVNLPKIKNKKKAIIVAALVVVVIIGLIVGLKMRSAKLRSDYSKKIETTSALMLTGAAEAEDACNLIKSVWYNTIYEEQDSKTDKYTHRSGAYGGFYDDFNDAISSLFADSSFSDKISDIQENQSDVASAMKELTNPPEEYKEEYDALKDYYDAYLTFTNMAINPTGNLQTYSTNFSSADAEALNCYNKMELYFK